MSRPCRQLLRAELEGKQQLVLLKQGTARELVDCVGVEGVEGVDAVGEVHELAAEELRLAARALGHITGNVDVEELLDVIFADFCCGK